MPGTHKYRDILAVTAPLTVWLVVFFLIPVILLCQLSFYGFDPMRGIIRAFTMKNYVKFFLDTWYLFLAAAAPSAARCSKW